MKKQKLEIYEMDSMPKPKSNVCGILSLIFGIVGMIVCGFVLGPAAIVLGIIGLKKNQKYSLAGLILGIIDVSLLLVLLLFIAVYAPTIWTMMF